MRIAIMQPYFFPYAGYFRLFSLCDLFVIFDCVQFPRRGWVHRNCIQTENNKMWFRLPLKKQPREIKIKDLCFHENAEKLWGKQFKKLSQILPINKNAKIKIFLSELNNNPLNKIVESMQLCCEQLGISKEYVFSSQLNIPESIKGSDRIIEICKHFKAKQYLNLSGGRNLYDFSTFIKNDIQLQFLSPYSGNFQSLLPRLFDESNKQLFEEFFSSSNQKVMSL